MTASDDIRDGHTSLGIELGSTRIKACLIGPDAVDVLATGSFSWENSLRDGLWTYGLDEVERGLQAAYADLVADAERRHGVRPDTFGAIGISAMMHGYLAFDAESRLLVPFRTWRNTSTGAAAAELTDLLGVNIPLRWSIAHLHQAVLDAEPHVAELDLVTTLAGYVHWRLTGERVLGVGDASGMFPIDSASGGYDERMLDAYAALAGDRLPAPLTSLLPRVLPAGAAAGSLTAQGAALLDPTGALRPGIPLCAPEGDAGTGMVATNSVSPRTGNVSAGTSIFAMVVLENALTGLHEEIDLVTTPAGDPVAMVHCNNGASEIGEWAGVFREFADAIGADASADDVFAALLSGALERGSDDGLLAYNHLSGEPIAGLDEGRPIIARTPSSKLSLNGLMRAQVRGSFATLSLGMRTLAEENVEIDGIRAHGGIFRTAGVAQRLLADALAAPITVGATAGEGGAWGMAILAAYAHAASESAQPALTDWLDQHVFAEEQATTIVPEPADVAEYAQFLDRWEAGLDIERTAVHAMK